MNGPHSIELHIEELVLHGFAPGDSYRIAGAVERELVRLFGAASISPSLIESVDVERLDGGAFQVALRTRAETVGAQVSRALYNGLIYPKAAKPSFMGGDE